MKGKSLPLPGFLLVRASPIPTRIVGGLAVGGESRRRPGADGRPAAPRWQVGPGPPSPPPPPPPCVSSRRTLRFARKSGAPRSARVGLPGLGHEEPQVPPEEAGRARPRAVRRRRSRRQRGEFLGQCAPRAPGAALRRTAEPFSARLSLTVSRWVGPGDSSSLLRPRLRVGPETPGTLPSTASEALRAPFPTPHPWVSQLLAFRIESLPFSSRCFGVVHHLGPSPVTPVPALSPADPRTPLALSSVPALLGTAGAPQPSACGSGGGLAPHSPGGQGSGPGVAPSRLRTFRG